MEMNSLPKGFRFKPTGKQIMDFLKMKIVDHDSSNDNLIPEIDVLEFEPWEILRMLSKSSNDKECHFFAPRKRKYPGSDRADRCTRAGHWKPTGKRPKISTLGIKRRLTFYLGRPHAIKTDYIMHQYELNDMKEFALCCLKRNKGAKSKRQDINSNTSSVEDNIVEDAKKGSPKSLVQPFQMLEQEANQDLFVPPLQLYGEIDYTDQMIRQEANQELLFSPLQMCDDIDYASLGSLEQIELYDHNQLPEQEANQEMLVPPFSMSNGIDYTSSGSLEQSELYDQLYDQEANQEILVQPLRMHGCIDSTGLSSIEHGESLEDFDNLIASFISGFQPESPMGSEVSNETLQMELAIDESQVINGGMQAPAVV